MHCLRLMQISSCQSEHGDFSAGISYSCHHWPVAAWQGFQYITLMLIMKLINNWQTFFMAGHGWGKWDWMLHVFEILIQQM